MIICKRPAPQQTDRRTDRDGQEGKEEGGERGEEIGGGEGGGKSLRTGQVEIEGSTRGPRGPKKQLNHSI